VTRLRSSVATLVVLLLLLARLVMVAVNRTCLCLCKLPLISLYGHSFGQYRRHYLTISASSVLMPYAEHGADNGISTRHRRDLYGFFHERLLFSAFRSARTWRQDVRQPWRSWSPHVYLHRIWRFSSTIQISYWQGLYFHINSARSLFLTSAVYVGQPMAMIQWSA